LFVPGTAYQATIDHLFRKYKAGRCSLETQSKLQDVLASLNPGKNVLVSVYRGNQQLILHETLNQLQARS
jgi:hypothetical protein